MQETDADFQEGVMKNVRIKGNGPDAKLVLEAQNSSDSPQVTGGMFKIQDEEFAEGGFGIKARGGPEFSHNGGVRTLTKKIDPVKPSKISFYIKTTDDLKEMRTSFNGVGGADGIALTTKIKEDLYTSSGTLKADDGQRGVSLTDTGYGRWAKVTIEDIDFVNNTYDISVEFEFDSVYKQNVSFCEDVDKIASVSFTVGPNLIGYWDSILIDGEPLFEMDTPKNLASDTISDSTISGTFVSAALDTQETLGEKEVDYQNLSWDGKNEEKIKFQLAHSEDGNNWSDFVGPDGTSSSFYEEPGVIRGHDNYRFLKFKAYLRSDSPSSQTSPELENVTITFRAYSSGSQQEYVSYRIEA